MTARVDGAPRRLPVIVGIAGLVVIALVLLTAVASAPAQAAAWHTKLSGAGHHDGHHAKAFGPAKAKLWSGRATRLRYWTACHDDTGHHDGEHHGGDAYDWVKLKLIRADTGKVVKTFGPYDRPTGEKHWRSVSIKLPKGGHRYKLRAIADDARFGFRLQQRH